MRCRTPNIIVHTLAAYDTYCWGLQSGGLRFLLSELSEAVIQCDSKTPKTLVYGIVHNQSHHVQLARTDQVHSDAIIRHQNLCSKSWLAYYKNISLVQLDFATQTDS